jgi:hypothetical protein
MKILIESITFEYSDVTTKGSNTLEFIKLPHIIIKYNAVLKHGILRGETKYQGIFNYDLIIEHIEQILLNK